MKTAARYVVINAQETCFIDVVTLLPGWFTSRQQAESCANNIGFPTGECLYYCKKLDFTEEYLKFILDYSKGDTDETL